MKTPKPPEGTPRRRLRAHHWLTLAWLVQIPAAVIYYFLVDRETFVATTLLYLVIVSQYANMATHWGARDLAASEVKNEESDDDEAGDSTGSVGSAGLRSGDDPGHPGPDDPGLRPEPAPDGDGLGHAAAHGGDDDPYGDGTLFPIDPINARTITGAARPGVLTDAAASDQDHH